MIAVIFSQNALYLQLLTVYNYVFLGGGGGGRNWGLPKVQMKDVEGGGGGYRDLAVAIKGFS